MYVDVDGARSALPPISMGSFGPMAFKILACAERVLSDFSPANVGSASVQPSGSLPLVQSLNCCASSGNAAS